MASNQDIIRAYTVTLDELHRKYPNWAYNGPNPIMAGETLESPVQWNPPPDNPNAVMPPHIAEKKQRVEKQTIDKYIFRRDKPVRTQILKEKQDRQNVLDVMGSVRPPRDISTNIYQYFPGPRPFVDNAHTHFTWDDMLGEVYNALGQPGHQLPP